MQNLPYFFMEPLIWWAWKAPKRIFTVLKRVLVLLNHEISFTLNIRLLFVPLFGDYTISGRVIGIIMRLGQILFGLVAVLFLLGLMLVSPFLWYYLPLFLIHYLKFYFFFVLVGVYLLRLFLIKNTPLKRVSQAGPENYLSAVRPECLSLLKEAKYSSSLK
ncbi:MAG TPA: hypothetical protein ENN92_00390, partial [candidate division WWE3 bacterium]|nr:hypothetical protein [candidate division WWE3 bacterium]